MYEYNCEIVTLSKTITERNSTKYYPIRTLRHKLQKQQDIILYTMRDETKSVEGTNVSNRHNQEEALLNYVPFFPHDTKIRVKNTHHCQIFTVQYLQTIY